MFLDFFSLPYPTGGLHVRPTGIYLFGFLFRGSRFPYFAFVVFSTGEKSLAAVATLRSIFYFTIRDVFGAEWKASCLSLRQFEIKKKECVYIYIYTICIHPWFEFVSLSFLRVSTKVCRHLSFFMKFTIHNVYYNYYYYYYY